MELIDIISGADLNEKEKALRGKAEKIRTGYIENKSAFFVELSESEKRVLFPVLMGLGIPFKDADPNGVIFGKDVDCVEELYRSI